jgi:hypothetical protein
MVLFSAAAPVTHLGGWLVKVFLYAVLLGLSFLPNNDSMEQYGAAARGFSVLFLLLQVLIIIDFAYNAHQWLVDRMDAKEEEMAREGFEPGICSNMWRNLYVAASAILFISSIVGIALLYHYYGNSCPLHNFYISETLVIGVVFTVVSLMNVIGKGLLPPSILFAYNTYLCYGALTNNPDLSCNPSATTGSESEASIYTGLAIAAFAVTWMAYNSAKNMRSAVSMDASGAAATHNPAGPGAKDWPSGREKTPPAAPARGSAATYQGGEDDDEERGKFAESSSSASTSDANPADDSDKLEDRPWIFHIIMCLAGMYLAMLVTNWGNPDDANSGPTGNPELSTSSMWARIGSQWAIHLIYLWTMVAPICCPNRDFGR